MKMVLFSLLALSLLLAGLDAATTSSAFWYRQASPTLFLETWAVWAVIGSLAVPPTYLAWRFVGRRRDRSVPEARRDALRLACLILGTPVATHMGLNAFLPLGAGLDQLFEPKPLLAAAGGLLVSVVIGHGLALMAQRGGPGFLAAMGAAGLALGLVDLSGGEQVTETSGVAAADAPNLLLMVWDTTRAQSLDVYGNPRTTAPRLAEQAQGMQVFDEARSTAIFTLTSHLSMLTGTYPTHHGARMTRMTYNPVKTPSMARLLQDAGYRTGAFVGTAVLNGATGISDGFEVFDDRVDPDVAKTRVWAMVHDLQAFAAKLAPALGGNGRPHWFEDFDRPADQVLANALEWIQGDDPRPWFCMINMYDVHWPYLPGKEAAETFVAPYDGDLDGYLFRSNDYQRNEAKQGESLGDSDLQYLTDLYEAEIFELDGKVAAFWQTLHENPSTRELGAIVTADHGEAFGEGSRFGHNDVLEVQVRVPFLMKTPDDRPGSHIPGKVSGVDIAPTLLSFAGIERPQWMVGMDLGNSQPSDTRIVLVEDRDHLGPDNAQHALYREDWKLLVHGFQADGDVELFDLSSDPLGVEDVAGSYPAVVEELTSALHDLRASWGPEGGQAAWAEGDIALADHLKGLGYGGE